MIPVPNPEEYDVSLVNGFLPTEAPLQHLSDPYYQPWEYVVENLQGLVLSKRLREVVDKLPVLSTDQLLDEAQWRRAYSVLAFIAHAYIWGDDKPAERVPPPITIPFLSACDHLELPPVATYAGLVLWNWRPIFNFEKVDTLANLDTINTFTGSLDEKWFYLVSIAIEARGGPIVPLMLRAIKAANVGDRATVTECLKLFAERLDELTSMLVRMYDNCDPHVFYHRIRPFLAGSKNMAQAGLPNGVIFDNGGPINKQRYVQFSGGSNAQSSLIQFFDLVLGVEHHPTGPRPAGNSGNGGSDRDGTTTTTTKPPARAAKASPPGQNFIHEMRKYMPGAHARFLQRVGAAANLRAFVQLHGAADPALRVAFDACLAMLSNFRDKHIQMVSRYIIVKSREAAPAAKKPEDAGGEGRKPAAALPKQRINIAYRPRPEAGAGAGAGKPGAAKTDLKGTGGTSLIPFLRQARDETGSLAVDAWTRRLLVKDRGYLREDELKEAALKLQGPAGVWQDMDSWGGLCQI